MSYESWRISFQSSEQAARAAYAEVEALRAEIEALRAEVERLKSMAAVTMGVGSGDGNLFVHGDYDSIKAAQALVLRAERLAEALRELVDVFSESGMYDEEVFDKARAALAKEDSND